MNRQTSQLTDNCSRIRNINVRALKQFAANNLPDRSPLRTVLLGERDEISPNEFLAKLEVWLVLLRLKEEFSE
jgi:hypothetical protein